VSDEADRIRTYQELARRGQPVPGKNFGTGVTPKTKRIEPKVKVIDTTKSMPVGMMDGGKVKKMNMGGVAKGRGGMFKGIR